MMNIIREMYLKFPYQTVPIITVHNVLGQIFVPIKVIVVCVNLYLWRTFHKVAEEGQKRSNLTSLMFLLSSLDFFSSPSDRNL